MTRGVVSNAGSSACCGRPATRHRTPWWLAALAALAACDAGVNGPGGGGQDAGQECCSWSSCGAGLVCAECSCVPAEDCCEGLGCEAQGQVCSGCMCRAPEDDGDGDGYPAQDDCDDDEAGVHPGAEETCNGTDDDCDGRADEDGCAIGSCCAGSCVRTDDDPGNCGGCGVDCDDGDFCTADRCEGGACVNEACAPGSDCCVPGPCYACCDDADCDDGDACTVDRCEGGTCSHGNGCGGGEQCCGGQCAECCGDGDCEQGRRCDGGACVCGPAPHWQEVGGDCRPSCGAALQDANYYNNGGGCCPTGCTLRETIPTWDCTHCCETAEGVSACL